MTVLDITLGDAHAAVQKVSGSAPRLLEQARRCLKVFEQHKDQLPAELAELASIERLDHDQSEMVLRVHRRRVVGRFEHAMTGEGHLVGQFVFTLVHPDDSEQALWAFTFDYRGFTSGIATRKGDESGIADLLVADTLAHLSARVQALLPRAG